MTRIFLAMASMVLFFSFAHAGDGRKIDFSAVLVDADNAPIDECADPPECKTKRPLTLGAASMRALAMPEQNLDPAESGKRGYLALSVYKSVGAELTAEEIALIKKQIAKAYNPLVAVRAFAILDPASAK